MQLNTAVEILEYYVKTNKKYKTLCESIETVLNDVNKNNNFDKKCTCKISEEYKNNCIPTFCRDCNAYV